MSFIESFWNQRCPASRAVLWEMEQLVAICRFVNFRSHFSLRTSLIFRMDNLLFAIDTSSAVFEEQYR